ncbi:MAG: hypothetical protein RIC55_34275 [Pirellulaceae bacterium]
MAIQFLCPACQQPLAVSDEYAGRQIQCTMCGFPLIVPVSLSPQHAPGPVAPAPTGWQSPSPAYSPTGSAPTFWPAHGGRSRGGISKGWIWAIAGIGVGALTLLLVVIGVVVVIGSQTDGVVHGLGPSYPIVISAGPVISLGWT